MKLKRKLPLAFASLIGLTALAGFGGLWMTHQALGVLEKEVPREFGHEREAAQLQSHFKTQVQEWKDILLRG